MLFPLLCLAALLAAGLLAGRALELPGLYYDEVVQAEPAARLVFGEESPLEIPGARSARGFGRWLPFMTQPYMGALKSWLLVPSVALFGADAVALRATTLAIALAGLVFTLRFARALGGLPLAGAAALLACCDPSLLFSARHDWGSFSLGFALRAAALDLAFGARQRASHARALAAGLAAGLALYNKIDAAVFFGAVAAAAWLSRRVTGAKLCASAADSPKRLGAALGIGAALGAAPLLAALPGALAATRTLSAAALQRPDDWSEKARVLLAALDGSYFERLMRAGGSFEAMSEISATPLPLVPVALAIALPCLLWRARSQRDARAPALAFLALAALFTQLGLFLMPRAVRIHHVLGSYPLPQLALAAALALPWNEGVPLRRGLRVLAACTAIAIATGQLVQLEHTFRALAVSGGKGRWSSALQAYAEELEAQGAAGTPLEIAALDWGLDLPLRYAHRSLRASAPFWELWTDPPASGIWRFDGGPSEVYLVYDSHFAVFPYGPALLAAARALPEPAVAIRAHADAEGDPAFYSLRFAGPHRLIYRAETGRFEVRLR